MAQNFVEFFPPELSVKIFLRLNARSLSRAAATCRLWRNFILHSDALWRNLGLRIRTCCQREVDRDRKHGLSWKVTVVRNYLRWRLKRDWLRGRYSELTSAKQLPVRRSVCMDAETWGEILQAELDR